MNFEKYKNTIQLPAKPYVAQGCQIDTRRMSCDEALSAIDNWREKVKSHYALLADYAHKRNAYDAEEARLHGQFKSDLFRELEIAGHPKAEILYQKAWEQGHSAGYEEVFNCANDLVDLLI